MPIDQVTSPITATFGKLLGGVITAIVILIIAWIVAAILRWAIRKILNAFRLDERVRSPGLTAIIASIVFWVTILIFLPSVLGALGATSILEPLNALISSILAWIPQIIAAIVILIIGVFIARLLRQIVTGALQAIGTDRLGSRVGFQGLSALVGLIVYILVLVPTLIAAMSALNLTVLTAPLTAMLTEFLNAIPNIIAALVLIIVAYYIGRVVGQIVTDLLTGLGFNRIFQWMGVASAEKTSGQTPSKVVGTLVFVFIVYTAVMQAVFVLGWSDLGALLSQFLVIAIQVILGLIIIGFGLWLATMVGRGVRASGWPSKNLLALIGEIAIFILFAAMGLTQMGLGQQIVVLAFGLTLGGIAIAGALAFGLGGRTWAGQILEDARSWYRSRDDSATVGLPSIPPVSIPPATTSATITPPAEPPATPPPAEPPATPGAGE
ncbi:MAG: mechanosensitive ion channel [Anaerolineae bacterium]